MIRMPQCSLRNLPVLAPTRTLYSMYNLLVGPIGSPLGWGAPGWPPGYETQARCECPACFAIDRRRLVGFLLLLPLLTRYRWKVEVFCVFWMRGRGEGRPAESSSIFNSMFCVYLRFPSIWSRDVRPMLGRLGRRGAALGVAYQAYSTIHRQST